MLFLGGKVTYNKCFTSLLIRSITSGQGWCSMTLSRSLTIMLLLMFATGVSFTRMQRRQFLIMLLWHVEMVLLHHALLMPIMPDAKRHGSHTPE
jgi:hypothetical protein